MFYHAVVGRSVYERIKGEMRIGIDVSQIVYGTGVSSYTKSLVGELVRMDRDDEFVLVGGSLRRLGDIKGWVESLEGRIEGRYVRLSPRVLDVLWNRLHKINFEKFSGKVDVYHSSDWAQAPSRAFCVTTVHDLAPLKFPRWTNSRVVATHKRRLGWVKKEADRIIVPSKSTKKDLMELGFEEEKIRVIYEAPEKIFERAGDGEVREMRRKFRLNEKYLLMVGTGERKNLKNIIRGFELSREGERQLAITGNKPEGVGETRGVKYLGYVSDMDLVRLYTGAEALVYATLYEGFGLPILQAMACGCPVVTSNVSSMPEVAGDAGVLVDPNEPSDIASGIKKVLKDRENWIKKGRARVKEFSWERAAKETLEVYRGALVE